MTVAMCCQHLVETVNARHFVVVFFSCNWFLQQSTSRVSFLAYRLFTGIVCSCVQLSSRWHVSRHAMLWQPYCQTAWVSLASVYLVENQLAYSFCCSGLYYRHQCLSAATPETNLAKSKSCPYRQHDLDFHTLVTNPKPPGLTVVDLASGKNTFPYMSLC